MSLGTYKGTVQHSYKKDPKRDPNVETYPHTYSVLELYVKQQPFT